LIGNDAPGPVRRVSVIALTINATISPVLSAGWESAAALERPSLAV
jgi:hypothetical protein